MVHVYDLYKIVIIGNGIISLPIMRENTDKTVVCDIASCCFFIQKYQVSNVDVKVRNFSFVC